MNERDSDKLARRRQIAEVCKRTGNLAAAAAVFGITRERARQIFYEETGMTIMEFRARDIAALKATQKLEGHLAHKRHQKATEIAQEAVEKMKIDEDDPL